MIVVLCVNIGRIAAGGSNEYSNTLLLMYLGVGKNKGAAAREAAAAAIALIAAIATKQLL